MKKESSSVSSVPTRWRKKWLSAAAVLGVPATLWAAQFNELDVGWNNLGYYSSAMGAFGFNNYVSSSAYPGGSVMIGSGNFMSDGYNVLLVGSGNFNGNYASNGFAAGSGNYVGASDAGAIGKYLQSKSPGGVVVGKYNKADAYPNNDTVFVVGAGTGTAEADRLNALVVKDDGTVIIPNSQGDIEVGNYQ